LHALALQICLPIPGKMETTPLPGSAPPADPTAYQQWLDEIVSLKEGARLRDVSVPTLRRAERKRIINTSKRRLGIRRRHALMLP